VKSNSNHVLIAGAIWVVLMAIGEALTFIDIYPTVGSEFAEDSDFIFTFLTRLGIPVFAFVVSGIAYAVLRWRTNDIDDVGEHIRGTGHIPRVWVGVTGALALFVMVYPGLTGVAELRDIGYDYGFGDAVEGGRNVATTEAVVLNVTGFRWAWTVEYEGTDISLTGAEEMVLPVDRQIWVRINSTDVLHSFWVPAFRQKIDVIPGRTTELTFTPIETGNFAEDAAYRLQCAELCGRDHTFMMMPVAVVEQQEFEDWLGRKSGGK